MQTLSPHQEFGREWSGIVHRAASPHRSDGSGASFAPPDEPRVWSPMPIADGLPPPATIAGQVLLQIFLRFPQWPETARIQKPRPSLIPSLPTVPTDIRARG